MTIRCMKCNSYYDGKLNECPYCGTTHSVIIQQKAAAVTPLAKASAQEQHFCVRCGAQLEQDAAFCTSCGNRIEARYSGQSNYSKQRQSNFVMDKLNSFANPNGAVRILCVVSSILFMIAQFFGMKFSLDISLLDLGYSGGIIKLLWQLCIGSSGVSELMDGSGKKWVIFFWILLFAFAIGFLVLIIVNIEAIRTVMGGYHVESVVDAIKGMSTCAIVMFGATVILGNVLAGMLGIADIKLSVDFLSYLAVIWAIIMRIFSGMIVKSELERE